MANTSAVPDLATVVQHITNAQPTNINALAHMLRSFDKDEQRDAILGGLLPGAQDPLAILNPRTNTLGYLYILSARLAGGNAAAPVDATVVETFCARFDAEQARLSPSRVTKFAKDIVRWAEGLNRLKLAIGPLHHILTRYPPESGHLTPIHPIFVQACLKAQHTPPSLLRPILSDPITRVSTALFSDLHYNDNLIYHYVGGIIFGLWKDWESADEFFEICVTSPAQVPSAIQWDALKKYVLVQCIYRGKTKTLPKYVHATLGRLLKNSPYGAFQRSYPRSTPQLRELLQKEAETFSTDKNQGLIALAMEAAPRWNIKRLTDTYLSLSLTEIGNEVGISSEPAVRALVISMIERGEITATLGANGSVAFADAPVSVSKAAVDTALREAQVQGEMLVALEREVGVSKEFLTKILKAREDDRYGPGGDVDEMMFGGAGMGGNWTEDAAFS